MLGFVLGVALAKDVRLESPGVHSFHFAVGELVLPFHNSKKNLKAQPQSKRLPTSECLHTPSFHRWPHLQKPLSPKKSKVIVTQVANKGGICFFLHCFPMKRKKEKYSTLKFGIFFHLPDLQASQSFTVSKPTEKPGSTLFW